MHALVALGTSEMMRTCGLHAMQAAASRRRSRRRGGASPPTCSHGSSFPWRRTARRRGRCGLRRASGALRSNGGLRQAAPVSSPNEGNSRWTSRSPHATVNGTAARILPRVAMSCALLCSWGLARPLAPLEATVGRAVPGGDPAAERLLAEARRRLAEYLLWVGGPQGLLHAHSPHACARLSGGPYLGICRDMHNHACLLPRAMLLWHGC